MLVERVARLHQSLPCWNDAGDDDAGDARTHLGDARRRDAARQLADDGDRLGLHLDDSDRRRRGSCGLPRRGATAIIAAGKGEQKNEGRSQTTDSHWENLTPVPQGTG